MEKLTFVVPTLLGVEGLTADELRRMGMAETRAENGRVLCQGEAKDIPRLNLRLRTGERVYFWSAAFLPVRLRSCFKGCKPCPGSGGSPKGASSRLKGIA